MSEDAPHNLRLRLHPRTRQLIRSMTNILGSFVIPTVTIEVFTITLRKLLDPTPIMQFVANGPDIPDLLLQAHEEGRVVFFCGAGISYPAGLPGFKGLVDEIYRLAGTSRTDIEQAAYERDQYDATLDLLERRLPGQRIAVRHNLKQALQPRWRRKGATATHEALLELSRCREGSTRLVTTNFDRVFERVGKRTDRPFNTYAAPMLPIPKNSRWNGLVYLHGLLPRTADDNALHRLVLTSGDFGLAYLTERWAARFVGELFRNYLVCFVGYSLNDPVMRYMMDALAADRMQGEITPQAYALGECEPGQEKAKRIEWEAKGVNPILYEVPAGGRDHSKLHGTLKAWAETYRDGVLGKERIVVDYALARPSASTHQDDFVGRMLWALSHESGMPAKRFAEFNPAPALDWLEAFSERRYFHKDLNRFGVPSLEKTDDKLRFSLICRPSSYRHAPWMTLTSSGSNARQWDNVMLWLARWLMRHLDDPNLIIWVAQQGGQLHESWAFLIEQKLDHLARLTREKKAVELDEIRTHSPNAVPRPPMQALWRLLLTDRIKSPWCKFDIYRWKERFVRDGLTASLRLELRDLLAPKVKLKKPIRWSFEEENPHEITRARQLVDWELVLTADDIRSSIKEMQEERWHSILPKLLNDFQQLLRDALDLMRELGEAEDHVDGSYWDLPSIIPHWQNRGFRDWVSLIELLRDAWLTTRANEPKHARQIALEWFEVPYPTFKRLALFAASQDSGITSAKWIKWLIKDDGRWLWSPETQRETLRLLVLRGATLSTPARTTLEDAILRGPPRHIFRDDIEPEYWKSLVDESTWLRLAKLHQAGGQLGEAALLHFNNLSAANLNWQLTGNERDEFPHWMSGTGDPDYESNRYVNTAPRKRAALAQWLKQPQPKVSAFIYEDTWPEVCRTRFFHSLWALCDLAREELWPATRWREALQAWSEESRVSRSWNYAAPLVQDMPDSVIQMNALSLAYWMSTASKITDHHEVIMLSLCRRILSLFLEETIGAHGDVKIIKPVSEAINHPIGYVTQTLLNLWVKRKPGDNELLPTDIEPFFTQLSDTRKEGFRHGRVLLASRIITLYRVDRPWTEKHLVPLFDWQKNSNEAKGAWEGFLWSPRLYRPLQIALKSQFLATASHYMELGDHRQQFAALLTYAALDLGEPYTSAEFRAAISALPQEGLEEVAQSLSQTMEGAGDQREDYWKNRVQPFWQEIWPKSLALTSNSIAESLATMSIAAGGEFPSALSAVADWLRPVEHPNYIVSQMHDSGLCSRFPKSALRLLNAVVVGQPWIPTKLRQCLQSIAQTNPDVRADSQYRRLDEHAQQHGN